MTSTNHSSPRPRWGQRTIVLLVGKNFTQHWRTLGISPPTLLPMSTPALIHILDHQLGCQRRIIPTILTLLLLFGEYASNDNKHYIHGRTISLDSSCHRQTHQDNRGERFENSIPHEQGQGISIKHDQVKDSITLQNLSLLLVMHHMF